jgi:UDP-2-acetamido-2,6-beta-L-arabino-hexul-4-ose reductase
MPAILLIGHTGFIGKNIACQLDALNIQWFGFNSKSKLAGLPKLIDKCDYIINAAGINRPNDEKDFFEDINFNCYLIDVIKKSKFFENKKIVYLSSTQSSQDNLYGNTKREIQKLYAELINVKIFELPNVYGKWCRENYNSVVATFSHGILHDTNLYVNNSEQELTLIYIDDLVSEIINEIQKGVSSIESLCSKACVTSIYKILEKLNTQRLNGVLPIFTSRLEKNLYATLLSYINPSASEHMLEPHYDNRGFFLDVFNIGDLSQVSFFTMLPGKTRGGHYHNSKVERFFIAKGIVLFRMRNIISGEYYEKEINSNLEKITVDSIPGWTHSLENIGNEEVMGVIWISEIFDPQKQDTIMMAIS